MPSNNEKNRRLIGVLLLGIVLFNHPILSLFNSDRLLFGIPTLYVYLFAVWAVLILLISMVSQGWIGGTLRNRKSD